MKREIKRRLIVVSRGEDQIFRGVLKAVDEWPPQRPRRRPPDAVWYSHRFIVVEVGVFPPQAVVLNWPGSPEGQ